MPFPPQLSDQSWNHPALNSDDMKNLTFFSRNYDQSKHLIEWTIRIGKLHLPSANESTSITESLLHLTKDGTIFWEAPWCPDPKSSHSSVRKQGEWEGGGRSREIKTIIIWRVRDWRKQQPIRAASQWNSSDKSGCCECYPAGPGCHVRSNERSLRQSVDPGVGGPLLTA